MTSADGVVFLFFFMGGGVFFFDAVVGTYVHLASVMLVFGWKLST